MTILKSILLTGIATLSLVAGTALAQSNAPTNGAVGDTSKMTYGREADNAQDQIRGFNAAFSSGEKFVEISPEAQVAQMGPGVNWGGYDPFLEGGQTKFKLSYIRKMRDAGFTTLRIPLFTFKHMDTQGHLDPAWLNRLDQVVEAGLHAKMTVILDEHDFDDCAKDTDACSVVLPNVWYELSARYKSAPNSVIFELLNEPHGNITDKLWNAWLVDLIGIVRETNPTRNVIVGPIGWNSADQLDKLTLPDGDHHLIATFHYYTPMEFTHQGATWAGPELEKLHDVRWTGTAEQTATINTTFDKVSAWGKAHNRPIFLGEYGTYGHVNKNMDDRVAWTSAVSKAADARGFARAYWDFAGPDGFGVFDNDKGTWVEPLKNALVSH